VEPRSPFGAESQPRQVPLHRIRQGLMPPRSNRGQAENSNVLMLAHTKGHEGNLPVGTQIRRLRISGPLDGEPDALDAGYLLFLFVPRSGCSGWL
jgi:hypothetical protein